MSDPVRTLFCSKYALAKDGKITEGVYRVVDGYPEYFRSEGGDYWNSHRLGKDVHETREAAVKAAEAARHKKVASLEKQIRDLKAKVF